MTGVVLDNKDTVITRNQKKQEKGAVVAYQQGADQTALALLYENLEINQAVP
jgi:hypothetical protein